MINRAEKRWIWYTTIIVIIVTTIPYVVAYVRAGQDWRFSGFLFGVEDGNSYIAKMLRGANGDWLFKTPYSTMVQGGAIAFLPYLILGKIAAGKEIHEQLVGLFQIFRWVGIYCYLLGSYSFVSRFVEKTPLRRLGTMLCVAGGGLGWLYAIGLSPLWQGRLPLEFYSPESFGFLSVFGLPHLAMARGFLLLGISWFMLSMDESAQQKKGYFIAAIFFILVGFLQPLTVLVGWMVICICWLVEEIIPSQSSSYPFTKLIRDFLKGPGWVILLSSPIVIYTFIAFQLDPFLRGWTSQNKIISPPFTDYLLAYGMVFICVVYFIWKNKGIRFTRLTILFIWGILLPLLAYYPYNLQRRMPEGIWSAYAVMMVIVFDQASGWRRKVINGFVICSFLSTIIFFSGSLVTSSSLEAPIFLPVSETQLFNELKEISYSGEIIFSDFDISNSIPAWVPLTVIIGHGPESINQKSNMAIFNQILMGGYSPEDTHEYLIQHQVRFILLSPDEEFTKSSLFSIRNCLSQKIDNNGYQLYRFNTQCP